MTSDEDEDGGLSEVTAEKAESSTGHNVDAHSSSTQDDPSTPGATKQAETFATELSSIQTARKRNLMTMVSVSNLLYRHSTI